MKKILTIIPYFGGVSNAPRQTELNNVLKYFKLCYGSVEKFSHNIIVSVSNVEDYETVSSLGLDIEILKFYDIDPIFNPANMNRAVQQMNIEEDYIFFTESDQIIYYKNLDLLLDTIDKDKNIYIVPQRFEQIPANRVQDRKDRFGVSDNRFITWRGLLWQDNNPYVVANDPAGDEVEYDNTFYRNFQEGPAYGAAFLCHKDLFMKATFHDSFYQPTETSAGHDLLNIPESICLKTTDYFDFFVDHLSGWEFNTKTL